MNPAEGGRHTRVAFASELGCKLNVDLSTGRTATGGAATDDTEILNAFLATASAKHPIKLFLDGPALVRGLVLSPGGNTTIEGLGWGTGLYLADGANADVIRIGQYTGGLTEGQGVRPVPPRETANITLRDFSINGNSRRAVPSARQGFVPKDQPRAGLPEHFVFGVALANCSQVVMEHLRFENAACYAVMLANVSDVRVAGCSFYSGEIFQDGVHVDGPAERIVVHGCTFATGDDAVALNAPEGYGGHITDVIVTECGTVGAHTMMRIYSSLRGSTPWQVRGIVVANCTGSTRMPAFNLGIENAAAQPSAAQVQQLLIAGCVFDSPGFATVQTPFGSLNITDCTYLLPRGGAPMVNVASFGAREISLRGARLLRLQGSQESAPLVSVAGGAAVDRLVLGDVSVVDDAPNAAPIPYLLNAEGVIGALRLDSLEMAGVRALMNPATGWGRVGRVYGGGVLASGVPIPEALAGDNTMFVSADTGAASIKSAGKVRRLS